MHDNIVSQICGTLDVNATKDHGAYLGLPFHIGRKKRAVFNYIRDSSTEVARLEVQNVISSWEGNLTENSGLSNA